MQIEFRLLRALLCLRLAGIWKWNAGLPGKTREYGMNTDGNETFDHSGLFLASDVHKNSTKQVFITMLFFAFLHIPSPIWIYTLGLGRIPKISNPNLFDSSRGRIQIFRIESSNLLSNIDIR